MCDFCDNFDFGSASCRIENFKSGKQASIIFAGGSNRFNNKDWFNFCPKCGKEIKIPKNIIFIGEEKFKIRPIKNQKEWDRLMDIVKEDNDIIHWKNSYSLCIDKIDRDSITRGYDSTRFWDWYDSSYRSADLGFRPILEPLNNDFLPPDIKNGDIITKFSLIVNGLDLMFTDKLDTIKWIYFDGKLVADRNLVTGFSYDDLNNIFHFE